MFMFVACKYIQTRKAGAKLSQETLQGFQNEMWRAKRVEAREFASVHLIPAVKVGFKNGVGPLKILQKFEEFDGFWKWFIFVELRLL